jgi:acetyl esterase/lipase
MRRATAGQGWDEIAAEAFTGFREWRVQHPRATFKEMETALDGRLARVRARVLADAAMASAARDLGATPAAERPVCPDCGGHLVAAGQEERVLTTSYEQPIALRRSATRCAACGRRAMGLDTWPSSVPVQVHFMREDPFREQAEIEGLEAEVRAAGAPFELFEYDGAGHLFTDPSLPSEYDGTATERLWDRVLALLASLPEKGRSPSGD